jgi:type II secretory pathway component PulM
MPYIGFEIPTLLVAFVWLTVLGRERWLLSAVLAVVITVVLWLLFIQLFDVPLPHLI